MTQPAKRLSKGARRGTSAALSVEHHFVLLQTEERRQKALKIFQAALDEVHRPTAIAGKVVVMMALANPFKPGAVPG